MKTTLLLYFSLMIYCSWLVKTQGKFMLFIFFVIIFFLNKKILSLIITLKQISI